MLIDQQKKMDEINKKAQQSLDTNTVTTADIESDDETAEPITLELPEEPVFETGPVPTQVQITTWDRNHPNVIILMIKRIFIYRYYTNGEHYYL